MAVRWPDARSGIARLRRVATLVAGAMAASCLALEDGNKLPLNAPLPPSISNMAPSRPAAMSPEDQEIVTRFGGIYRAPAAEALVKEVVDRLSAASDDPHKRYTVAILNTATVNAFALPSGRIYVTRGLLALANDSSELAAVIAHEIAHITAGHAKQRSDLMKRDELISRVSSDVLNDPNSAKEIRATSQRTLATFSRLQELEADQISVRTIAKAGYDPYGATRFLISLGRLSAFRAGSKDEPSRGSRQELLSSHPSTPERVARTLVAARQIAAPGTGIRDRERYLRSIDGIAYGENPSDGIVRGRRFIHPKLRITFTAPEGFEMETSADAVIGADRSANRALRFDAIKLERERSLTEYLRSGLLQEGSLSEIEDLTINRLPAATGLARGSEWSYRVTVVRAPEAVYRFIFAARNFSAEIDRQFKTSQASFRTLESEEIEQARQTRIEMVIARSGESAASLAARMEGVVDRPLERFNLLNGLEGDKPLVVGEAYKIIME